MSTKRKPPRKTPWARRIISSLILLAALALLIFLGVKAAGWLTQIFHAGREVAEEQAAKPVFVLSECTAKDVDVTLSPASNQILEGGSLEIGITAQAAGDGDCYLTQAELGIALTMGDTEIWNPGECSEELQAKTLLLSVGQPWVSTLTWDGRVWDGCEPGSVAPEGPYLLGAWVKGSSPTSTSVIEVQ